MINTFRVLSHPRTRLETTISGQLFTWMTRQKDTQRLNEIEEQRYLSFNSNSRFMVEQRYGNRYRTIHSPRKYHRYFPTNPLINKLIVNRRLDRNSLEYVAYFCI